MGESESKFRPEPQDVWYKMRRTGKQPRLLQSVMQAICDLREIGGSTQCKISEYLDGVINCLNIRPRPRGLALQVRNALNHGIENGLIKQKGGKFSLALNAKDFAIFKSFRSYDPIFGQTRAKQRKQGKIGKSKTKKVSKQNKTKCKSLMPVKNSSSGSVCSFLSFVANDIEPQEDTYVPTNTDNFLGKNSLE